jgi:predicted transposase YbfD/YdcC
MSVENPVESFEVIFSIITDPRVEGRTDHRLIDIMMIAILATIAGSESWRDIETFGETKQDWLSTFLELPNGIPSHDTFARVFALLDPEAFQKAFYRWVEQTFVRREGEVIAIDGKTLRGSDDRPHGKAALHMVSAWASERGIVLGQRKTDDKSNEITAIPELLRLLNVTHCTVTLDAMGCQTKIAQQIRDEKADYILCVKDNQKHLHIDLQDWFAYADQVNFEGMTSDYAETINKGHGRIEIRRCWAVSDPLAFEYIRNYQGWTDLQTIIRVERERCIADKRSHQVAYYISSLKPDAKALLRAIRQHWHIENSFHWVLDVTFGEDQSRIRTGNAAQNLAVVRHLALNIIKRDPSKGGIKQKRYRAAMDNTFLLNLLVPV